MSRLRLFRMRLLIVECLFFVAAIACGDSEDPPAPPSTSGVPLTASPTTVDLLTSLSGYWTGTFEQPGVVEYPIILNFSPGSITVDYPSIPCGGTLKVDQLPSGVAYVTERIETGVQNCIDRGIVVLSEEDGVLTFSWRRGTLSAVGKLTPAEGPPPPITPSPLRRTPE